MEQKNMGILIRKNCHAHRVQWVLVWDRNTNNLVPMYLSNIFTCGALQYFC
jgi:hypothetical protein